MANHQIPINVPCHLAGASLVTAEIIVGPMHNSPAPSNALPVTIQKTAIAVLYADILAENANKIKLPAPNNSPKLILKMGEA